MNGWLDMKVAICDDCADNILRYTDILTTICRKHKIELNIDPYCSSNKFLFEMEDIGKWADVVYLDIDMPGTNGVEVAKQLREMKCSSDIIFLTASTEVDNILSAFDVNAFHYIIKEGSSEKNLKKYS